MDLFDLRRPDHLDDAGWEAVQIAQRRLKNAWELDDLPEVIGKAKELVETVAKVVVAATQEPLADGADFVTTVKRAQRAIDRVPAPDVSGSEDVRAIAQGAQTIVTRIAPIRNSHGTGHGHARVPDVVDEMATITLEAALLWTRWALRRLGHVLADYPNDLIEAVNSASSLKTLQSKFDAAVLSQQPSDVQQRVGVAFGQQVSGGYGNARKVGIDPVIDSGDESFPVEYRVGLLKGMLMTGGGHIGLTVWRVPQFAGLLVSLPHARANDVLGQLSAEASEATWIQTWRGSTPVNRHEVVDALRAEAEGVPAEISQGFGVFCDALSAVIDEAESTADASS
ncbi:abortive infection family protein [Cellulomonas taurus]|uniref:abortive infection family protein n=1 Tax=Cellulomonas taurus TaxID=2729175 RepID=UPI00145D7DA5|nr:abortive infection family protein [Cellulomonas taurus]